MHHTLVVILFNTLNYSALFYFFFLLLLFYKMRIKYIFFFIKIFKIVFRLFWFIWTTSLNVGQWSQQRPLNEQNLLYTYTFAMIVRAHEQLGKIIRSNPTK